MSGVSRWVSEGVSATLANSPVYTNNLKETLTENASVISLTHILMCQSGQLRLIATGALVGWLALLAWPPLVELTSEMAEPPDKGPTKKDSYAWNTLRPSRKPP